MSSNPESSELSANDHLAIEIEEFLSEYLPDFKKQPIKKHHSKVVHDGLWGTLKLKPHEVAFIDTPLLQRLRQIHQMGCAYLTYPSTTHTRMEHTFGVMLKVEKLGESILKDKPEKMMLDEGDVNDMRLAALLHDIGHGPFSHTSEEIFENLPSMQEFRRVHPTSKAHEGLAYLIITSPRFREYCNFLQESYQQKIDPEDLAKSIIGDKHGIHLSKYELLNGPFDADKLDYLFRDSHFSGIPLSVDLDRLWYSVQISLIPKDSKYHLTVNQSGAGALEQILFAKMNLFTTLYHHHKIRACDCMFMGIIEYMKSHESKDLVIRDKVLTWNSPIDFLWLTDYELMSYGFRTKDENLHRLIHNLYFRRLLKRVLVISQRTIKQNPNDQWDKLQRLSKKDQESSTKRRNLALQIWEKANRPCLQEEVWIDLPELPNMSGSTSTFVIPDRTTAPEPITLDELFPSAAWTTQYGMNKWRGHIFCPEEAQESIAKAARDVIEDNFGVEILDEAFRWCKVEPPRRHL